MIFIKKHLWLSVAIGVIVIGMLSTWPCLALTREHKPYNPVIDPANFVGQIDNPYLPMTPGTTFKYEVETDDGLVEETTFITHETKTIMGVVCTVVRDTATVDGQLEEDTFDWYVQDTNGNVWYFGEYTTSYQNGEVIGHEGSWEAGVDGALPGIVMMANPLPGKSYRQEYLKGVAEDMAKALRLNARVSVAYGDFENCLVIKEWTPLEPGQIEHKYYAPGVGLVLIMELKGKNVRTELVDIITE